MAATAAAGPGRAPIPAASPSATAEPPLDRRRMVAFLCMVFGMFMAILDIQIVSASLNEIQAGLSAVVKVDTREAGGRANAQVAEAH